MIKNDNYLPKKKQHSNLVKNQISLDKRFHYEILSPIYIDQVVDVFTHAFCRSEPMTHYLRMDEDKYKIFARTVSEKACEDKLSIVALDGAKVIACALVEDLAVPGPIPDFDPKFEYILSFLEKLGKHFFSGKIFFSNHIAHLFITAVDENYRHRGLSTQVNFRAMDLAAEHNFEFVYCELTHPFNESGIIHHLKNPKRLIGSCNYHEFVHKGIRPFANLSGEAHSYLWSIMESVKLVYKEKGEIISTELDSTLF